MEKKVGIVAVMLMLVAPVAALAQASITGTVKDPSGAVLPGVTVEAASPALIERVRTTVTDGSGGYRITTLRPGTYEVTFTLPGFNTVKREGIELSGDFVATLNTEMRVGAIEETITVTGETPIVDVQTASQQRVLQKSTLDELPTGRAFQMVGFLIPGMNQTAIGGITGAQDVGGARGTAEAKNFIHGGRGSDQMWYVDGLMNMSGVTSTTGGAGPNTPDMGGIAEVAVTYSAGLADMQTGGVNFNLVPREGGNRYSGSFHFNYGSEATQGDNLNDRLRALGINAVNTVKLNADLNPSFGGPIQRDKLWFFSSFRYVWQENYAAGNYYNKNVPAPVYNFGLSRQPNVTSLTGPAIIPATAEQLNTWTYAPDTTRRGYDPGRTESMNLRLTYQVNQNNKIASFFDLQRRGGAGGLSSTNMPESVTYLVHQPAQAQTNWSSPVTNRLLVEAGLKWVGRPFGTYTTMDPRLIPVTEQSTGLVYRNAAGPYHVRRTDWGQAASLKYVTGRHDMKIGIHNNSAWENRTQYNRPLQYRFNNGVPNQITQTLAPWNAKIESDYELGIYAQDRWTIGRATLAAGLRFDYQDRFFPEQHLGPTIFTPTRDVTYPETQDVSWKDLTPRFQGAFDLFGNGRTALKVSASKYTLRAFVGYPDANPVNSLALTTTRSWTDSNGNFIVDCDLTNNSAQTLNGAGGDVCGAVANSRFGSTVPQSVVDPDIATGWGKRGYNWEFSSSVQQQLSDRMSLNVGYFRRIYGNFTVTDNLAVTPADFTSFSLPIPADSRLPDAGGTLNDLVMVSAAKFGQVDNRATLTQNFGRQYEHYNGVDVSLDARMRNGLTFQGGVSTGKVVTDNCEVAKQLPELGITAITYCHVDQSLKYATQFKALGSYTIPRWGVLVSATFQSLPGPVIAANQNVAASVVAAAIGRPVPGNPATVTVGVVAPNTLYGDWLNQLDLRLGKTLRFGGQTARLNVDMFNALNANAIQTYNATYGAAWLRPTAVLTARLVKFSVQYDF